jgi:hypothetical protein
VFKSLGKDTDNASVPFKVLQQLFDKPEVSAPIIYDILPFVLDALHRFKEGYSFSSEVVAQGMFPPPFACGTVFLAEDGATCDAQRWDNAILSIYTFYNSLRNVFY